MTKAQEIIRKQLTCGGVVQGVGFRPAVHKIAADLNLFGWVRNDPAGAIIEVEGSPGQVEKFLRDLPARLPPLAVLESMDVKTIRPTGDTKFMILTSTIGKRRGAILPPDSLVCPACRKDMSDPQNRRYRYPFTTCTDCGPRFSIAFSLPYDRSRTSMACFPLCPDCEKEYQDPGNRRFHAEPVCCPACGPRLWFAGPDGEERGTGEKALRMAVNALERGKILAIKGMGGFHIVCRADDPSVVRLLRERKRRAMKPLAVMVRDLETVTALVRAAPKDLDLLKTPFSPILLLDRTENCFVAEEVAPGLHDLGVMIPTTPLHLELFREADYDALVMTSGNLSEEPICRENREALTRLGGIADGFLLHDRDIINRVDDSVVRGTEEGFIVMRRSRGRVPESLPLDPPSPEPLLALGGHLQVTACVAMEGKAYPSQHVGDQDSQSARQFLVEVVEKYQSFLDVCPKVIVTDAHPDYPSVWQGETFARLRKGQQVKVQHHLAHAASVLGEHGRFPAPGEKVAAVILDGTGWGPDGTAWGGEWFVIDGSLSWKRVSHLAAVPLVGGEKAVKEPWRVCAAVLAGSDCRDLLKHAPVSGLISLDMLNTVASLAKGAEWSEASGAGRFFEAVGALLGLATVNEYEGEAAARLETLAATVDQPEPWSEIDLAKTDECFFLPADDLVREAAKRVAAGESPADVAAGFHMTFCRLSARLARRTFPPDVDVVALGGGCFVNRILSRELKQELEAFGFTVLLPVDLPPGDGGLSFGQCVAASAALKRGISPDLLTAPSDDGKGV